MPRNNMWNILEELKVPFELRAAAIRLYESVIAKLKKIEYWSTFINCNIGVKQVCHFSPIFFSIYINKLEGWLEEACCISTSIVGIVIIIFSMLMILFLWKGVPLIIIQN